MASDPLPNSNRIYYLFRTLLIPTKSVQVFHKGDTDIRLEMREGSSFVFFHIAVFAFGGGGMVTPVKDKGEKLI